MDHCQELHGDCDQTMKVIGDYWTLAIIRDLDKKEMRFCEIQRAVEGINPVTLTSRLKKLEELGLLHRQEESLDKQSVTYRLTEKGLGLRPIIASIEKFAQTWGNK